MNLYIRYTDIPTSPSMAGVRTLALDETTIAIFWQHWRAETARRGGRRPDPEDAMFTYNVVPELGAEQANYGYSYDGAGNITKISNTPAGQTGDHQCYNYDYLRRLTRAWTPGNGDCSAAPTTAALGGPAKYWQDFSYDPTGNRISHTDYASTGNTTYTYTTPASGPTSVRPHTVTNVTAVGAVNWSRSYSYDNGGNTKTRPSSAGVTQTLGTDREGHVYSQVEGSANVNYLYDADGNRLIRTDSTGKTAYLPGGLEVRYTTAGGAKTACRYYTHHGDTIAMRTGAGLSWIVGDQHGTAELTIKASDLSVAKRRSMPFGAPRGTGTGTWPTGMDKGFVGGTDDPTGLTHLGAREYDPFTGRFLSVDPKMDPSDPQTLHGYLYSNNNPITFTDPTGEDWLTGLVDGWIDVNAKPVEALGKFFWKECEVQSNLAVSVFDPNVSTREAYNSWVDVQVSTAHTAVWAPVTIAVEAWDEGAKAIEALSNGDMEGAFHHGYVASADTAYTALIAYGAGSRALALDVGGETLGTRLRSTVQVRGTNKPSVLTSRSTFRKRTLQTAWDLAEDGPNGGKLCPTQGPGCAGEVTVNPATKAKGQKRDWDGSHVRSWTNRWFWRLQRRKSVVENYNEDVVLECAACNRSRGNRDWE